MQQERPLSRLATYVAAARARGRPTRLVLRNTDRMGLVHLYFQQGHLVAVEGHRGSGLASLADVITWQNGTIRQDDLDQPRAAEPDPALEESLADVVRRIQLRAGPTGALASPDSVGSGPLSPLPSGSQPSLPRVAGPLGASRPSPSHVSRAPTTPPEPARRAAPPMGGDHITDPQWQLITLALHQIVERAGLALKPAVAAGFLVQALTRLAPMSPFLGSLDVDEAGWLRERGESLRPRLSAYDVTSAVAGLLADYETRCATLIGATEAHRVIVEATAPLRTPLEQVGLGIAE